MQDPFSLLTERDRTAQVFRIDYTAGPSQLLFSNEREYHQLLQVLWCKLDKTCNSLLDYVATPTSLSLVILINGHELGKDKAKELQGILQHVASRYTRLHKQRPLPIRQVVAIHSPVELLRAIKAIYGHATDIQHCGQNERKDNRPTALRYSDSDALFQKLGRNTVSATPWNHDQACRFIMLVAQQPLQVAHSIRS